MWVHRSQFTRLQWLSILFNKLFCSFTSSFNKDCILGTEDTLYLNVFALLITYFSSFLLFMLWRDVFRGKRASIFFSFKHFFAKFKFSFLLLVSNVSKFRYNIMQQCNGENIKMWIFCCLLFDVTDAFRKYQCQYWGTLLVTNIGLDLSCPRSGPSLPKFNLNLLFVPLPSLGYRHVLML